MPDDSSHNDFSLPHNSREIRAFFPITQDQNHLMSAAEYQQPCGPDIYLKMAAVDLDARPFVREPIPDLLAGLVGGQPKDYAVTTSTRTGIGAVLVM